MNRTMLIPGLAILLLARCVEYQLMSYNDDSNFLSFNHPFTDKAIAEVQAQAVKLCGERKQEAIQTTKSCSLSVCTTNFQCVKKADVFEYGL